MKRQIIFSLTVMTIAIKMDATEMRNIAGQIVASTEDFTVPKNGDLFDYAIDFVWWMHGKQDKPEWC